MKSTNSCCTTEASGETLPLANALKALGHPARLEIIRQLAARERCCGGDFCKTLPLAQSTISQHLEMLRAVGLVDWRAEGTRSIYSLNKSRLATVCEQLAIVSASQYSVEPNPVHPLPESSK